METLLLTFEEYWGYYWRVTQRHTIPGIFEWDRNLVDLIEQRCELKPSARILDLGCGGGDQAKLFARKGYRVTGIDKVKSLVEYAIETFNKESLRGEFHTGDMRQIEYQDEFDLCVILSGTFGLFKEIENEQLLQRVHKALKPGGQAFLDYLPLESFCNIKHSRRWNTIDEGFALAEEWFDVLTSTYRTRHVMILNDGRIIKAAQQEDYNADEVIRCYSVRGIEQLSSRNGFRVKKHLCKKQIGEPEYVPDKSEPRGMVILQKEGKV